MRPKKNEKKSLVRMEGENVATTAELIQFLQAAHVSASKTDWPFEARGGVVLCAPPEQLKTSVLCKAFEPYHNADVVTDVNARQLNKLREKMLNNKLISLGLQDYQKVWERDESTAAHAEGILRSLTDEGWRGHAENSQLGLLARAFVVICITPSFFERVIEKWESNGFARRFLILHFTMPEIDVLVDAIRQNHPFQTSADAMIRWPAEKIPMIVTDPEFEFLRVAIKHQVGTLVPLQFCKRVLNTLKWHYRQRCPENMEFADDCANRVFMDVVPMMRSQGGQLVLKTPKLQIVDKRA